MNASILEPPPRSQPQLRFDIIRWVDDSPAGWGGSLEPPLASWLVDVALDGKRRKPSHIVWKLLQHIAPTFDMTPRAALGLALNAPYGTHGLEIRPAARDAALWRKYGQPDSIIRFQGQWIHRFGQRTVTVGLRGDLDMHLPPGPGDYE